MTERSEQSEPEEDTPAHSQLGAQDARSSVGASPSAKQPHKAYCRRCQERSADKGMRDAAMMLESGDGPVEVPQYVEVGSFRSQGYGQRGQCSLAVKAGAAQASAGEKVRNRIQVAPQVKQYEAPALLFTFAVRSIPGKYFESVGKNLYHRLQ